MRPHKTNTAPLIAVFCLFAVTLTACDNPADETFTTTASEAKEVAETATDTAQDASQATTIALTGDNTTVEWTGSKPVGSKHDGGFKTIEGQATLLGDQLTQLQATIDITSMWSDADKLTAHLLNADFFDSDKHPSSQFITTDIRATTASDHTEPVKDATHIVTGNFTLRGVTKSITFPAAVSVDASAATLETEFNINRGQFGMSYGLADAAIRDEVVIRLKLNLKR